MAFQALLIFKRSIGLLSIFFVIIFAFGLGKMNDHIFKTMQGLGIKKIKGILGGGKMAIHTVGDKPLRIIDVG